jgi:hypothetical protein
MERVSVILPVGISCHSTPLQTSKPFEPAPKLISASRHARHNNDLKAPQHSSKQTAGTTAGRMQHPSKQAAGRHGRAGGQQIRHLDGVVPSWGDGAAARWAQPRKRVARSSTLPAGTGSRSSRRGEMTARVRRDGSVVGQSVAGQQSAWAAPWLGGDGRGRRRSWRHRGASMRLPTSGFCRIGLGGRGASPK